MIRLAVLVSGSGTTLQALLDAFGPRANAQQAAEGTVVGAIVAVVVSNRPEVYALERARRAGVVALVVDHRGRSRAEFEAELAAAVDAHRADLICLAGFLRILSPDFVSRYAGRILNTHPALLPEFGGRGMYGERVHQAVLAARVPVTGCTIHVVDEVPDGGPIVAQVMVPVREGDTPESLAARVQDEERRLYVDVIRGLAEGRITVTNRAVSVRPSGSEPFQAAAPVARPSKPVSA